MFSLTVNSLLSEFYYVGQLMVDQNDTRRRFPSRYTGCAKTVKNRSYSTQLLPESYCKQQKKGPTSEWWANASETLARLHTRRTNRHNAQAILELVGQWYVGDFPTRNSVVHFEDKTVAWTEGIIETIPNHARNTCYTLIPVALEWVPAEEP